MNLPTRHGRNHTPGVSLGAARPGGPPPEAATWQSGRDARAYIFPMTPQAMRPPAPPMGWVM